MKIYAKQTPPEYQDSSLYFDEFPDENIQVFGNTRLAEFTTDQFKNIPSMLEDIADEIEYLKAGRKQFSGLDTILEAYTGRDDYTRQERKKWLDIIRRWTETDEERGVFADVLELLNGEPYSIATIRGGCQSDWQYCIYPTRYGREWLEGFESEYFNTGTEWQIYENGLDGDSFGAYCTANREPREFIAEITGSTPENIILLEFTGWTRTPEYREVQA